MSAPEQRHLLVIGRKADPHAVRVEEVYRERGYGEVSYVLPDAVERLTFEVGERSRAELGSMIFEGTSGRPCVVWWRDKNRPRGIDSAETQIAEWSRLEAKAFLQQAVDALGFQWVIRPSRMLAAQAKVLQLLLARRVGFKVPATVVTSKLSEARAFLDVHPKAVMKPFATPSMPGNLRFGIKPLTFATRRVSREELDATTPEEFEGAPLTFQPEIDKAYEIRAVAFLNEIHFYRIDLPGARDMPVDWRKSLRESRFTPTRPPRGIATRCTRYLRQMGIACGSFDFAVDREGEWWFLECNPDGQWAWLDDEQRPISTMYAEGMAFNLPITRCKESLT